MTTNVVYKAVGGLVAAAALLVFIGWLVLSRGWLEIPLAELEKKYTTPASRWIDIDGIRVHYFDESPAGVTNAPVVVLSHASLMSLRCWDCMAAALVKSGYRVISMDYLNAGVTSFEEVARVAK